MITFSYLTSYDIQTRKKLQAKGKLYRIIPEGLNTLPWIETVIYVRNIDRLIYKFTQKEILASSVISI